MYNNMKQFIEQNGVETNKEQPKKVKLLNEYIPNFSERTWGRDDD